MKRIRATYPLFLLLLSMTSFAYKSYNIIMPVHIANNTPYVCQMKVDDEHGTLISPAPESIAAHASALIMMADSGYRGPDVSVTLACGDKTVKLRAHNPIGFFSVGDVESSLLKGAEGIVATRDTTQVKQDSDICHSVYWSLDLAELPVGPGPSVEVTEPAVTPPVTG